MVFSVQLELDVLHLALSKNNENLIYLKGDHPPI